VRPACVKCRSSRPYMNIFAETPADQQRTATLAIVNAHSREHAEMLEDCKQLRTTNGRLRMLYKELENDLAAAARVQQHLEPRPMAWGRVRVDTFSQPARTVGGDFGVVCPLDGQYLNLLVCDVSGHGISAALAASRIFSEASAHLQTGAPLGDVLSKL